MASDAVTLLVVGDRGVGRSSLIATLCGGSRSQADFSLSLVVVEGRKRLVVFLQPPSDVQPKEIAQLHDADGIILAFDASDRSSLEALARDWVPLLVHSDSSGRLARAPILLAACKYDALAAGDGKEAPWFASDPVVKALGGVVMLSGAGKVDLVTLGEFVLRTERGRRSLYKTTTKPRRSRTP